MWNLELRAAARAAWRIGRRTWRLDDSHFRNLDSTFIGLPESMGFHAAWEQRQDMLRRLDAPFNGQCQPLSDLDRRCYSSFQLHASSSVGAILVIAQWGRGARRIQDSPLHSIAGLIQVKFAVGNADTLLHPTLKHRAALTTPGQPGSQGRATIRRRATMLSASQREAARGAREGVPRL